jgi:hypothetical protein
VCKELWAKVESRDYERTIQPWDLVRATMMAFVTRLSGLRAIAERCGGRLGTTNFSSLSHAFSRASSLAFVQELLGVLQCRHTPGPGELVPIDGMAVTLPKAQRHNCAKYNHKTVGGGVVWAYMIHARKDLCPIQILKVIRGAWHDSTVMRQVALIARGPTYLMDRGFYCLELLQTWLDQRVHFIVRCRGNRFQYEPIERRDHPRTHRGLPIVWNGLARLGCPKAKVRPVVRLVIATLSSGEQLILASDHLDWSAGRLLDAFKQRWHIERFHRFLKDTLGLAHLYNFRQNGIEFLLHVALLTALLLFLSETHPSGETIAILRRVLRDVRRALGLGTPWKRNTYSPRRAKSKSQGSAKKKKPKNH